MAKKKAAKKRLQMWMSVRLGRERGLVADDRRSDKRLPAGHVRVMFDDGLRVVRVADLTYVAG